MNLKTKIIINKEINNQDHHTDIKTMKNQIYKIKMNIIDGKRNWAEVVGLNVDEAIEIIKKDDPTLNVIKMEPGKIATRDYRPNRVFVYYDFESNLVNYAPGRG